MPHVAEIISSNLTLPLPLGENLKKGRHTQHNPLKQQYTRLSMQLPFNKTSEWRIPHAICSTCLLTKYETLTGEQCVL